MNNDQRARDFADQKILNANEITYNEHKHFHIDGEEADKYLAVLFEQNFPKLHNEAMTVAKDCANQMAISVLAEVHEMNPDDVNNFRRPNVQAAFLAATQSFAETGDPDTGKGDASLGLLLSKLVAKLVANPNRNLTDIVTRRAIAIAPLLTRQQINSLTVLAIYQTCTFRGESASEILSVVEDFFKEYAGDLAVRRNEYSYMESVGVGSVSMLAGFGTDPFGSICKKYKLQLRKGFTRDSVPDEVSTTERAYLETDPDNNHLLRIRADKIDDLLGDGGMGDLKLSMTGSKSLRKLRSFINTHGLVLEAELKAKAQVENPILYKCFSELHSAGAFGFQLNTIGFILAKQELDIRFPGNVLLEPWVDLSSEDEAKPGGEAEPHSEDDPPPADS
jgi:hypothetical protein